MEIYCPKVTWDYQRLEEPMVSTVASPVKPNEVQASDSSLAVLRINGAVVIRPRNAGVTPPYADPLTERELEVISLVAEGYSNKLTGARLNICERTVKNHLTIIMTKLRASDRTHAVVTAVRLGWLAI